MSPKGSFFRATLIAFCAFLAALAATGCGSGSQSLPTVSAESTPRQKAVITLSTTGSLSPGTSIGGLGITVVLPDTVYVRTTGGNVSSGVVAASGVASGQATVLTLYSGATTTLPAKLYLVLAGDSSGLPVGEFATITVDVKSGSDPAPSDFTLDAFSAVDTSGVSIPTVAADFREAVK
jgi:hypothetical protein